MLTGMDEKMYEAQKHRAKVTTIEGDVFVGVCTTYTCAYDNDPDEASIIMKEPLKNSKPFMGEFVELYVSEIKEITLLD